MTPREVHRQECVNLTGFDCGIFSIDVAAGRCEYGRDAPGRKEMISAFCAVSGCDVRSFEVPDFPGPGPGHGEVSEVDF